MPSLPGATSTQAGGETLLLTPDLDQASLHQLVARLRDLGIELLELRQATTPKRSRRADGAAVSRQPEQAPDGSAGAYELRINGLLGPVLLGALPHDAVALEPRHTFVVTSGEDGADLLDVLQLLVDTGVEVEAVREITAVDAEPEPT